MTTVVELVVSVPVTFPGVINVAFCASSRVVKIVGDEADILKSYAALQKIECRRAYAKKEEHNPHTLYK